MAGHDQQRAGSTIMGTLRQLGNAFFSKLSLVTNTLGGNQNSLGVQSVDEAR